MLQGKSKGQQDQGQQVRKVLRGFGVSEGGL